MATVTENIQIGRVSGYLSSNKLASGKLHGGHLDKRLPSLIYSVTQGLVWLNELDPSNASIDTIGNYLYSICRDAARAQAILAIGGGSSTISSSIASQLPYYFIVSANSFMVTGASSQTITAFVGLNLIFTRNGIPQTTVVSEPSYFSFDKTTGAFTCTPELYVDELIALIPV